MYLVGSNRMLLSAWKHDEQNRHRNRKDYLLYFQRFRDLVQE